MATDGERRERPSERLLLRAARHYRVVGEKNNERNGIMAVYLVTYDLVNPKQYYDELYEALHKYECVQLCESSWAVQFFGEPQALFADLKSAIDYNDRLFICELRRIDASQQLSLTAYDWLLRHNVPHIHARGQ